MIKLKGTIGLIKNLNGKITIEPAKPNIVAELQSKIAELQAENEQLEKVSFRKFIQARKDMSYILKGREVPIELINALEYTDTSNATIWGETFYNWMSEASGIPFRPIPRLDMSGATWANKIFMYCYGVKYIPECRMPKTSQATDIFNGSTDLITIGLINISSSNRNDRIFYNCPALQNIVFEGDIIANISFGSSPNLTSESVVSIITALKDLMGQPSQAVTFHSTIGNKLTNEQKAIITAKNWTLVY